jgi:large-conductance mechanosensitive channel
MQLTLQVSMSYGSLIEAFLDFFIIGVTLLCRKIREQIKDEAQDVKDVQYNYT